MSEPIQPQTTVPQPIKPKKPWYSRWWFRIPAALLGVIMLLNAIGGSGGGKLPSCEGSDALAAVQNSVKNGPLSRMLNLDVLALKDAKSKSATEEKVVCTAVAVMNSGKHPIGYSFEWVDKSKGTYLSNVNLLDE